MQQKPGAGVASADSRLVAGEDVAGHVMGDARRMAKCLGWKAPIVGRDPGAARARLTPVTSASTFGRHDLVGRAGGANFCDQGHHIKDTSSYGFGKRPAVLDEVWHRFGSRSGKVKHSAIASANRSKALRATGTPRVLLPAPNRPQTSAGRLTAARRRGRIGVNFYSVNPPLAKRSSWRRPLASVPRQAARASSTNASSAAVTTGALWVESSQPDSFWACASN